MGCDSEYFHCYQAKPISTHALVWGATVAKPTIRLSVKQFQPTHPCGVRHENARLQRIAEKNSIHAPVWGATSSRSFAFLRAKLFQSTHPYGVRQYIRLRRNLMINFNPRTRMGCDLDNHISLLPCMISIHAPVWGATYVVTDGNKLYLFQSTHPYGVRQIIYNDSSSQYDFNPRTRMGCDSMISQFSDEMIEFQSTHPYGVRLSGVIPAPLTSSISIHAPVWGATPGVEIQGKFYEFQSTHPYGVRLLSRSTGNTKYLFQSTHPYGVRQS